MKSFNDIVTFRKEKPNDSDRKKKEKKVDPENNQENEELKRELDSLKKFKEDYEQRELENVAKKYSTIGRSAKDLVSLLKAAKKTGFYEDLVSIMDLQEEHQEAVQKQRSTAEEQIEEIAKRYVTNDPSISMTDAIAKAWSSNPDLYDLYEQEERISV